MLLVYYKLYNISKVGRCMFKDCFAFYNSSDGTVKIGNSRIEKILQIKGAFICSKKIRDVTSGSEWSSENSLWQRCPVINAEENPKISFKTYVIDNSFVTKPHLKAVIEFTGKFGTAYYEYLIFPEISFIYNQIFIRKSSDFKNIINENSVSFGNPTGIEEEQMKNSTANVFCTSDTLDCIPIGQKHINVDSFKLYDKTDYNDMLVEHQKASVYIFKNGELKRDGNIFCINDYVNGDSLMIVKHSPTESSALNRKSCDLKIQGNLYATLLGTGIDFSNIPEGKVPYYASALGVAKTDDIYEEYWKYNTSFCLNDPKKSLFIMSNTWGDRSQDMTVCETFILKELECAKSLGVDILQIDDGWQLGITANSRRKSGGVWEGYYADNNDFWNVNPEKFPNGLKSVIDKANDYKIEIGLWFSPDSSYDFINVDKDIETLMNLYNTYGIRYFKLDGVKIRNKVCEMRFAYMLEELTNRTKGEIQFNLDVTAEDRFGYLYKQQFGTIFVENRYTDYTNYFPHNTFKNVWNLSKVMPTRRLQMEILNPRRNIKNYDNILFAPNEYDIDYIFATIMIANPLFWMEMTNLDNKDAVLLSKIVSVYKNYKSELFNSHVIPIGNQPDGMNFSGYCCIEDSKKSVNVILFRETTQKNTYNFKLPTTVNKTDFKKIYQSSNTDITVDKNVLSVKFDKPRSFVWIRFDI